MYIIKICLVAFVTAVAALILKSQKSDLVYPVVAAGGIVLALFGFDVLSETFDFIKEFTEQTNLDGSVIRLIIKIVGVGYLIELTASSIKDLGFSSISDKLILCGKIIIFVMTIPVLKALFEVITNLLSLV